MIIEILTVSETAQTKFLTLIYEVHFIFRLLLCSSNFLFKELKTKREV